MRTLETHADQVLRNTRNFILPTARVCCVATFLEDGIRMMGQWGDQQRYINRTWHCGLFLASMFVVLNMTLQIVPSIVLLLRKQVRVAVACLCFVVLMQSIAYSVLWDLHFFLRNLAVVGGLMLVLAEGSDHGKRIFSAGLPTMEDVNKTGNYLQLAGRILIVVMFLTLMKFDSGLHIILELMGLGLVVLVAIGFKTKLAALILVVLLLVQNLVWNAFWMVPTHSSQHDFMRYDFFQTMSVVGGLLMVVALGPGGVSMDEKKKDW